MTVKPSEFTEETQNVLQIIDNEIVFFDYQVSDLIRSVSVNIWSCVDGEWVSVGKSYGNLASQEGRLAVRLLDGSWDIFSSMKTALPKPVTRVRLMWKNVRRRQDTACLSL